MGVNVDDPEDLRGQVEDLRSRLEEAEETLRAIRRGEVDALVVHEPGGDRVYTFQGADQAYRLLIEQMNEGAATLSLEGRILYGNRRLGEMVKAPLGRVIGSSLASLLDEEDRETFGRLLVAGQCEHIQGDLRLRAVDGTSIPVLGLVECSAIRGILRHRRDPQRPLDTQASGGSRRPPRLNRPVVRGRDLQQIAR